MHIPNQLKIAVATVVVVGGVSHAMLPASQHGTDPVAAQRGYQREYNGNRTRELEELRLRADREGLASYEEQFRPVEIRPKNEATAEQVMRSLLRRRP